MTPGGMMKLLRAHLSDEQRVGWPDDGELTAFMDRAADYLSERLIADRDPTMLARLELNGPTPLPGNFAAFAGIAPVVIMGGMCEPSFSYPFGVNYWAMMPRFSELPADEDTPYGRERELLITDIARMFALNRNEYDVTQDLALIGEAQSAIRGARSSAASGQ